LEIAPSTYWAAKTRPLSARAIADGVLIPLLVALFVKNYSVYGRRKLTTAARRAGLDVGRDQVARLMRAAGIRGASRAVTRFTTRPDPAAVRAPDLVKRDFTADQPDRLWVADFTYCSTWSGIVYVAFVVDVFSRRIVGWKAARTMHASLVLDALNMAAWARRGTSIDGLVCHSDAGSQPGFKGCSQHRLLARTVVGLRVPRLASSSRASCGAVRSALRRRRRDRSACAW
jgi:putative transposase